jgi:hypothetical protein
MIAGMYVSGYIVRFLYPEDGEPLIYGLFDTEEKAKEWADFATSEVVVEPVYAPVHNRG